MDYFRQRNRGWILSLLAAVCLVYLPFLGNPFVFDDVSFFYGNGVAIYADAPFRFDLRWLPYTSLAKTWLWVGDIPHLYRLGNVLLHAGNVILLFFLLRQWLSAVLPDAAKHSVSVGAWAGALVFACHPVAVYAVGYVVQRSILMATFFALLMQIFYLRSLLRGQKRWLVLSVLAYLLAGFSKEHSVMMPMVLLATTILLRDKNKLDKQTVILCWAAFAVVGVMFLLVSRGMLGNYVLGPISEPMGEHALGQLDLVASSFQLHLLSAFTQAGLFFKYLWLWVAPNPAWMSVDMREPFVTSLLSWQGWLGMMSYMAYGGLGFWLLVRARWQGLLGLALLYPWLQFVVEFTALRVQEPFVLYRSYLWMPGITLLIPLLLIKLPGRKTLLGLISIVLLLVPLAWNRLWVFGDDYRLWNDAAVLLQNERIPGADRILYNRGNAALAAHKWDEAVADLEKAAVLSPDLMPVHNALGSAYFNLGRYQEAIAHYDVVIAIKPDDARGYFGKGMSLKRLHADDQAMQQMQKACEFKSMMACMIAGGEKSK